MDKNWGGGPAFGTASNNPKRGYIARPRIDMGKVKRCYSISYKYDYAIGLIFSIKLQRCIKKSNVQKGNYEQWAVRSEQRAIVLYRISTFRKLSGSHTFVKFVARWNSGAISSGVKPAMPQPMGVTRKFISGCSSAKMTNSST